MMLLVACCMGLLAFAANANPVQNQPTNFADEVWRIVRENPWAAVGPNSTINSRQWTTKVILTFALEDFGEIILTLPVNTLPKDTEGDKKIDLIFNDSKTGFGVMISGNMKKLKETDNTDDTRGIEMYTVDILDIHLLRAGEDRIAVSREEYFAAVNRANTLKRLGNI